MMAILMGMEFVRTELITRTGNDDQIIVMPKSAIKMAVASDISAKVDSIPHKFHNYQVLVEMCVGATRMWEEKIVEIECDSTVN